MCAVVTLAPPGCGGVGRWGRRRHRFIHDCLSTVLFLDCFFSLVSLQGENVKQKTQRKENGGGSCEIGNM